MDDNHKPTVIGRYIPHKNSEQIHELNPQNDMNDSEELVKK